MLYGALKFLRFCFSFGKAATFVCDVLFMLTSAVALFLFYLCMFVLLFSTMQSCNIFITY